jgi:hypothetical protein
MSNWFEDLAKNVADEKIGRRKAFRRIAGGIAGAFLAGVIPGIALADTTRACPGGGGVCGTYVNCTNGNANCFCFSDPHSNAFCGCDKFCSELSPCSTNHDCPSGTFCAVNTCCGGGGVCISTCNGANEHCVLMAPIKGQSTATAAHQ